MCLVIWCYVSLGILWGKASERAPLMAEQAEKGRSDLSTRACTDGGEHLYLYHTRTVSIGGIPVPQGFGVCWAALSGDMLLIEIDRLALLDEAYCQRSCRCIIIQSTNRLFALSKLVSMQSYHRDESQCR